MKYNPHSPHILFWTHVKRERLKACWIWNGAVKCDKTAGNLTYGKFLLNGKLQRAHRVAWMFSRGEIPVDLMVLHKCDRPLCVNPKHLYLGTHQDNMRDMVLRGRAAWQKRVS